jgi:geranylgeranyl diphosphate synthase type I
MSAVNERGAAVRYPSAVDVRTEFNQLLADIEGEMLSVLEERDGQVKPLYDMLAYQLGLDQPAGPRGKRLRPLLGLLAYQSLGGDYRQVLAGAAAVELGHNFSLVHDDIEDADRERRHRPTLWAIWGVPLAINAGDALSALSRVAMYRLVGGQFPDAIVLRLMRVFDETCLALCEGQFLDIMFERRTEVSVEEYLDMITKKTAALIAASLQAGAMLATDDQATVDAYRRIGLDLGLAFQMADDVKGTFWSSAKSGKPEAGDVRRRKKTMPVVWAVATAPEADANRLRELYRAPDPDGLATAGVAAQPMPDEHVDEVLSILERCGARQHTLAEARRYRDLALDGIARLPITDVHRSELSELVAATIAT